MARSRIRFSRKDLEQLPEDWRAELIEGDLVMLPSPDPSHQLLVGELFGALRDHLGPGHRGRLLVSPTDVVIDDASVLQPDLLVLPEGARPSRRPWKIPPPIWVAEILSPQTAMRDSGVKLALYARRGVEEAWIVDPDAERIVVHDLRADTRAVCEEIAVSRAIAGFTLEVAAYFATLRG
ncbi:MAG: Uma2 family endonuclease [Planctomycetota bacterium]